MGLQLASWAELGVMVEIIADSGGVPSVETLPVYQQAGLDQTRATWTEQLRHLGVSADGSALCAATWAATVMLATMVDSETPDDCLERTVLTCRVLRDMAEAARPSGPVSHNLHEKTTLDPKAMWRKARQMWLSWR